MTRSRYDHQRSFADLDDCTMTEGYEAICHTFLIREIHGCTTLLSDKTRTGQMVCMNMGIQDSSDGPPMAASNIQIHFWIQGGINHNRLFLRANEVRQTPFSNSADLDHLSLAAWQWNICCVPGQAPGAHASLKGAGNYASRL